MKRTEFLKTLALFPLAATTMSLFDLRRFTDGLKPSDRMPALFIGHGSPTNALEENPYVKGWQDSVRDIPRPRAILCVSAHWETNGTQVTALPKPKTIHDFGGFQEEMYQLQYPAPGSPDIAAEVQAAATGTNIGLDNQWGYDHGSWVPLMRMFPEAEIPVLQLSLDYRKSASQHYALAQELSKLRDKGVLVVGSGNMVHNLGMARFRTMEDLNQPFGYDWAHEMNAVFKQKIQEGDHESLQRWESLHKAARLAIPTTDHYFPLLYVLAMQAKGEEATIFNDAALAGSLTMTSVKIS